MESRARLFGHSIHAMLVSFPVGLFVTAEIFDLIYLFSGGQTWALVSYWMIIAGIAGGLLAAVFGLIDYLFIPRLSRAKRIGRVHGIGNVIVVSLFAASVWVRHTTPSFPDHSAFVFSFLGLALACVTAWLGGELVERMGVGVSDGAHLDAPSSLASKAPKIPRPVTR